MEVAMLKKNGRWWQPIFGDGEGVCFGFNFTAGMKLKKQNPGPLMEPVYT